MQLSSEQDWNLKTFEVERKWLKQDVHLCHESLRWLRINFEANLHWTSRSTLIPEVALKFQDMSVSIALDKGRFDGRLMRNAVPPQNAAQLKKLLRYSPASATSCMISRRA